MKKILVIASVMLFGYINANALGTTAGTTVNNSASLTYDVGGVTQTVVPSNTDSFVVDKKIDFTLSNDDTDQIVVTPGLNDQNTTWTLSNTGNADQNFTLVSSNLTGGETVYADADSADTGTQTIFYSTDGGTSWTPYTGPVSIAEDGDILVRVASDIPLAAVNGNVMNIQLEATAVDATGADEVATAGADNQNAVDIVLAEGAGVTTAGNTQYDGKFSAWGGYIVETATVDLTKLSCVLSDGVSAAADSKRIPGATVIYMFDVNNTGATAASGITITDALQVAELDYASVANVKIDTDTGAPCVCTNGTAATGTASTNTGSTPNVTITGASVSAGNHTCISFEVDIL